jgi:hypothetical protein
VIRVGFALGLALALVGALTGVATAYPQFQLSKDQTCSGCHLSPSGGGLLNENGMNTAEAMSQFGTAPEFFYNKLGTPSWLVLGGDLRGSAGYDQAPFRSLVGIPMQGEVYARASGKGFTLFLNVGARPTERGNEGATHAWSREHYLQWQQKEGETTGLFVRLGRFMPIIGLRLAEHPDYTRQYGGTPLYSETYGVAVEYIDPKWEAHATGFIKDPIIDPVAHDNGAALYGEYRLTEKLSVGAEGMFTKSDDDKKIRGGITSKLYLPGPDILLQGELQFVNQLINGGGAPKQLVGYVLGSWFIKAFMLDLGLGHYDENLRIRDLDRDCIDLNFHWFTTSHFELIWQNRLEVMGQGKGGPTGAWSLLQLHYRL